MQGGGKAQVSPVAQVGFAFQFQTHGLGVGITGLRSRGRIVQGEHIVGVGHVVVLGVEQSGVHIKVQAAVFVANLAQIHGLRDGRRCGAGDERAQVGHAEGLGPTAKNTGVLLELVVRAQGVTGFIEGFVVSVKNTVANRHAGGGEGTQVDLFRLLGGAFEVDLFVSQACVQTGLVIDLPFVQQVQCLCGRLAAGIGPLVAVVVNAFVGDGADFFARSVIADQVKQRCLALCAQQNSRRVAVVSLLKIGHVEAGCHIVLLTAQIKLAVDAQVVNGFSDRQSQAAQTTDDHQTVGVHILGAGLVDQFKAQVGGAGQTGQVASVTSQEGGGAVQGVREHAIACGVGAGITEGVVDAPAVVQSFFKLHVELVALHVRAFAIVKVVVFAVGHAHGDVLGLWSCHSAVIAVEPWNGFDRAIGVSAHRDAQIQRHGVVEFFGIDGDAAVFDFFGQTQAQLTPFFRRKTGIANTFASAEEAAQAGSPAVCQGR